MAKKPEIQKIIDDASENIISSMGMPKARTTTLENESKSKTKREYGVKFFVMIDDESSESYSAFMTMLMNDSSYTIVREDKSWTQEGELIRVVDYIQTIKL